MITKENYEEFFLLYADNELPAEVRYAVERFVETHPELREELDTFLQCHLVPDTGERFPDKNSLLQYEESFLSYIDGELDETGRKTVEALVRQDPSRDRELKQLMMTVSHPDTAIAFPDKEGLYRTEKRRRVVMMPWLQAGVAAAVLAAVVLLALPKRQKNENVSGVVARTTAISPADTPAARVAAATAPVKNNSPIVTSAVPAALHSIKDAVAARHRETTGSSNRKTREAPPTTGTAPDPVIAQTAPVGDTSSRSSKLLAVAPVHPDKAALTATPAVAVNIPKEQSSFATQALLSEAQEDRTGEMADNMQQPAGKTKLRGLFRRVTRAFGTTADRDDDGERQVAISVFQVALK